MACARWPRPGRTRRSSWRRRSRSARSGTWARRSCRSTPDPRDGERDPRAEPAEGGRTLELTAADAGRVTLESNVTTGFAWTLDTRPASEILDVVHSEYVAPETDLVGAGGEEIWRSVATGEGTTELEMRYARSSGEISGKPSDLTVVVQPAD